MSVKLVKRIMKWILKFSQAITIPTKTECLMEILSSGLKEETMCDELPSMHFNPENFYFFSFKKPAGSVPV